MHFEADEDQNDEEESCFALAGPQMTVEPRYQGASSLTLQRVLVMAPALQHGLCHNERMSPQAGGSSRG
jgi:hypothetical protein